MKRAILYQNERAPKFFSRANNSKVLHRKTCHLPPRAIAILEHSAIGNTGLRLGTAGYLVLLAANAAEAISILETRHDVDLVCCDIDMPGSIDGSA
ncbi:MAG: hypothetical protein H7Y20_13465 [Bryobacteraceae bacterium]|nr:hypothetical protein [Bryobacteraceae bacterium]